MTFADATSIFCWTSAAAANGPLPGSLKSTRHVPAPVKCTVSPESEQPDDAVERLRTTVSPDVAEAPGEYDPPALPAEGPLLTVMVFDAYTLMLWVTCAAAAYVELPASLKLITHSPAPVKVTLPEFKEHPLEDLSSPMLTVSLDVACACGV